MIRKILESTVGSMTDKEFKETLVLANTDIVTNRVAFRRRTSLLEVVEIAEICFKALQRGTETNLQKVGEKETGQFNG